MNLNYILPVIIDEEKVVEIFEEDVARDNEKWSLSIVVYVVGTAPSLELWGDSYLNMVLSLSKL